MQGGFSFCGVDINELGQEYAPDLSSTYVYAGSDYKIHEQTFDGHDGGYFYGATVQPKSFSLRCIFQDSNINEGILTAVERFFARGKSGRLVFKKRPWVYYVATVVSIEVNTISNYLNGLVTINMKAYYPYGRCDELFYPEDSAHAANMIANSSMLPEYMEVPTTGISSEGSLTGQLSMCLYNGGTQRSKVAIEIAGNAEAGVTIANSTTGQKCRFVAINKASTTDAGRYIISDGMNGRTVQTNGNVSNDASIYHDYGFIDLEPNEVLLRDCLCTSAQKGYISRADGKSFPHNSVGTRIYFDGEWRDVLAWQDNTHTSLLLNPSPAINASGPATMATMNKITITPDSTMEQTRLNFVYKPTFY